ncbi:hypothetical protein D7B24_007402 [Verticillium nonalfalfae]|uniref:Uncharacterized protein n=1 Tax=Verticillium nonalfalfae TaxID=1051616 RepID=A0A3M9YJ86_9PEZI|nr:uncharacterized protein D7B24_007402 [Verticillium nonalfalfae]RNJ60479.1 hypothetical protein D7B24_007402 [Verticillium nonalfalfae]
MSRFFPHTAFAEDQPLARTILWTHVLTRAATMGSILGLGTFALRSAAGSRVPFLAYAPTDAATIRASTTLAKTAVPSANPSAHPLRAARLLGTVGSATVATVGITALVTIAHMWGRDEVEWLDRSWRLRANPFQTEVDDWTYGTSLAALGIAGVGFRKQMANLGWRGLVGVAGLGSVVGTVGYMGWRHGIKGGTFAA